jgi:hypothetical protein
MHFIIFLCASIFGNIGMYIMYITADNIVRSVLYYITKLFDLMMYPRLHSALISFLHPLMEVEHL